MFVCVCVFMYVSVCVSVCMFVCVCLCVCLFVCVCVCLCMCVWVCVYMGLCTCVAGVSTGLVCMHAFMSACLHVCISVCLRVCMSACERVRCMCTCARACVHACTWACMYHYSREQIWFRYPVVLNTGVHIIKVPVRTKGHSSVQCNIKHLKKNVVLVHQVRFAPDLVDDNWFSFHCALTATNLNLENHVEVTDINVKDLDLDDKDIIVELVDRSVFQPGQVNSIIFKFIPSVKKISTKCKRTSYTVTLTLKFSNGVREDVSVSLRCRNSNESFLFTFLDHDGSVQHAATIKPLKPCSLDICPVLLTLHGTGLFTFCFHMLSIWIKWIFIDKWLISLFYMQVNVGYLVSYLYMFAH